MNIVYLSIGTNIGDRLKNLQQAVRYLMETSAVEVVAISSIYETAAVGYTEQADFLNIAVKVETALNPFEMLTVCQHIEQQLGRVREFRWGPRVIDLDILLYNQENIEANHLNIPHKRMFERAFVLVPLAEITPEPSNLLLRKVHQAVGSFDCKKEGVILWKANDTVDEFVHSEN